MTSDRDPVKRFHEANEELALVQRAHAADIEYLVLVKRNAVLELRDQGLTWEQVGERLGISRQRAQQLGASQ